MRSPTKGWNLTPEAFESLLARLAPDRERAGLEYERIRARLVTFFECRGCLPAEEYADETINRVARRIGDGLEIRESDPASYFYGVARNVLRERWKARPAERKSLDDLPPSRHPFEDPRRDAPDAERRVGCLERCLDGLAPESRELIARYYQGEKGAKIESRKRLSEQLGLPHGALRMRAYRIRAELEACVTACLERAESGETEPRRPPLP